MTLEMDDLLDVRDELAQLKTVLLALRDKMILLDQALRPEDERPSGDDRPARLRRLN
jgi:hypothetical protein